MSDDNQILVPASFVALYIEPGRTRPNAARDEIAARHDFCEDLACLLTEHALNKRWELGVTEHDVLGRMWSGLREGAAGVNENEARWVITRLAELLEWQALPTTEPGALDT